MCVCVYFVCVCVNRPSSWAQGVTPKRVLGFRILSLAGGTDAISNFCANEDGCCLQCKRTCRVALGSRSLGTKWQLEDSHQCLRCVQSVLALCAMRA